MRWFIEVSNVGSGDPDTEYCVEAKQWQAALQQARKLRGEAGPLSAFSIELLDNGYRAVDKKQNLKYTVKKAPADAPLNDGKNGATSPAAEARSGVSQPAGTEATTLQPDPVPAKVEEEKAPSKPSNSDPANPSAAPQARTSGPPPKPRLESTRPGARKSGAPGKKGPQKVAELLAAAALKAGKKPSTPSMGSGASTTANKVQAVAKGGEAPAPMVAPSAEIPAKAAAAAQPQPSPASNGPASNGGGVAPQQAATVAAASGAAATAAAESKGLDAQAAAAPAGAGDSTVSEPQADAVPVPEYEVIRARGEEPSKETPITYREVALGVRPGISKASVEALLWARYRTEQKELAERPKGKFVQLAVFDHVFSKKPIRPPLATLQWKDWRGDPVLNFSDLIGSIPAQSDEPQADAPPSGSLRPTSVIPVDENTGSLPPPADASAVPVAEPPVPTVDEPKHEPGVEPAPGEASAAGPAAEPAQAQQADSEEAAPVPLTQQKDSTPPVAVAADSKRKPISEDLIGVLFEKMHDLHFMSDVVHGAEFVLNVVKQTLPSAYALVHVFDINTKNFVVVRQHGASEKALMFQTSDRDAHLRRVMRPSRSTNMKGTAEDAELLSGRWKAAQVTPDCLLCGPVKQGGRYLGLIELGNPVGSEPFAETEANALDYVCEQFAEFLANRPIVLDADLVLK